MGRELRWGPTVVYAPFQVFQYPSTTETEPLDGEKEYRLVVSDFILNGGDGFTMLQDGTR
jgi:hypothetical protein